MSRLPIALAAVISFACTAAPLEQFSSAEISAAMGSSLRQGADNAIAKLGREDGFNKNDKLHIDLPEPLRKVESKLRMIALGDDLDALETAMNRAAEAAVPRAKKLLHSAAIDNISAADAKALFTGKEDAVTAYFRKHTEKKLNADFLPVVSRVVQKAELADKYNAMAERAAKFGLMQDAEPVEQYVTRKALDGLYATMAEEERQLRKNPVKADTDLLKKVLESVRFGAQ
jgi:hypothetical protein